MTTRPLALLALGALGIQLGASACTAPLALQAVSEGAGLVTTIADCDPAKLIAALGAANADGTGPHTITLTAGCTYTLTQPDNWWYGPTGLPAIASEITIEGNGAIIERASTAGTSPFRLFYIAGPSPPAPLGTAGALTLKDLTLRGGLARGGRGGSGGGGGAGLGGAVLVQGSLTLYAVTLAVNRAQGGDTGGGGTGGGGGGMGGDGGPNNGGGGGSHTAGGTSGGDFMGGEGGKSTGAGGSGDGTTPGVNTASGTGGPGGGNSGLGGGGGGNLGVGAGGFGVAGDGGGGAGNISGSGGGGAGFGGGGGGSGLPGGGGGGGFGGGGGGAANGGGGGGGGVGGGGGGCDGGPGGGGSGGGGGFGGGGGGGQGNGAGSGSGGSGGFGGGGGGANSTAGGSGGFGGGNAGTGGAGGLGAGGAIFVLQGSVLCINSTLNQNAVQGGAPGGSALGGALFNLNGSVTVVNSTLSGNGATAGGAIYNLALGSGSPVAKSTLVNSILAGSVSGVDLYNDQRSGSATADLTAPNLVQSLQNLGGTMLGQPTRRSNPSLGALGDNGGPTPTMKPDLASLAFGAGDANVCSGPLVGGVDQRGRRRDLRHCSLGAYDTEGLGAGCSVAADCLSGFCADGVCCDTLCGDSSPHDCQVCSQALGAHIDGICGLLGAGVQCSAAVDSFDTPKLCSGSDSACPAGVENGALRRGSGGGISCTQHSGPAGWPAAVPVAILLVLLRLQRRRLRGGS